MKLTIETAKLQNLVAKSMKGASNNKMIPITGLMGISLAGDVLILTTTDATNYFYVEEKFEGEPFEVTVQADLFSKLIDRLSCEFVTLELKDNYLLVTGNGNYKIDLPLNEEGELVKYPNPINSFNFETAGSCEIALSDILLCQNTAKSALATEIDMGCYTGYYMSDKVVATDTYTICGIDADMFATPKLLSRETIDLLSLFTENTIEVKYNDDTIIFADGKCNLYAKMMENIENYQISAISGLLDQDFDSVVKIYKSELLQLLDRLSLFVGIYDKNAITLTFTRNGLTITSKQANSTETIPYQSSENFKDFTAQINIEMLRTQVKANSGDLLTIHYGRDNAIKLTDGKITQIIALLEE